MSTPDQHTNHFPAGVPELSVFADPTASMAQVDPSLPGTDFLTPQQARAEYDARNGVTTEHHDSRLTSPERSRIARNFEIEINAGAHGRVPQTHPEEWDDIDWSSMPSQKEYAAAKKVIDDLDPATDTLFIEGYGGGGKVDSNAVKQRRDLIASMRTDPAQVGEANRIEAELNDIIELRLEELEDRRANYEIDAFSYATTLAFLKGIQVVTADTDAFGREQLATAMGRDLEDIAIDQDQTLMEVSNGVRERDMRNIVKDWALSHMPDEDISRGQRKPKLALLEGLTHGEGIRDAFGDFHLPVSMNVMPISTPHENHMEQLPRMHYVATNFPNSKTAQASLWL